METPRTVHGEERRQLHAQLLLSAGAGLEPWAPAWAPDGKSIAVGMSDSIWRINPTTGAAGEMTADNKYHSLPAWSPDGRYLSYVADDGGTNIHLYMLEVATGKTWPLGNDQFVYPDPTFSPDGTRLAYLSTKPNGYFNVCVYRRFVSEAGTATAAER